MTGKSLFRRPEMTGTNSPEFTAPAATVVTLKPLKFRISPKIGQFLSILYFAPGEGQGEGRDKKKSFGGGEKGAGLRPTPPPD
jgi:hypothetical protein